MNHGHVWGYVLHLVGLQMTDEMPLHVARHLGDFALEFLHMALAKYALSCVICLAKCLNGMKLADSHECHAIGQVGFHAL